MIKVELSLEEEKKMASYKNGTTNMMKAVSKLKQFITKRLAMKETYTQTIADLRFELAKANERNKKAQSIITRQKRLIKQLLKGT